MVRSRNCAVCSRLRLSERCVDHPLGLWQRISIEKITDIKYNQVCRPEHSIVDSDDDQESLSDTKTAGTFVLGVSEHAVGKRTVPHVPLRKLKYSLIPPRLL